MADLPALLFHDGEVPEGGALARAAWLSVVGALVVGALLYVKVNHIGPRAFWATDACADPDVICGVMPLAILPATLGALVLLVAGFSLIELAEQRYAAAPEVSEDA